MKQRKLKKQRDKGITLIALIITVIVMLILAGVAINMTIGDNGIFKKTAETVVIHENASVYEQLCLKIVDNELGDRLENTQSDKIAKLKSEGYVNEDNSVNAEIVTKSKMKTGKGSIESGDVYVLETQEEGEKTEYYLAYYNDKNEKRNLGKVFDVVVETATPEDYFEFDPETGGIAIKNAGSYYLSNNQLGLKTVVIPPTYEGQTVTKIGKKSQWNTNTELLLGINCKDVERIVIPNTVTEIGELTVGDKIKGAFQGASNLREIVIPNSVKLIGTYSFMSCTNLKSLIIPDSVAEIGTGTFVRCTAMETITIPNSVNSIGTRGFADSGLKETIIPSNVTSIGTGVFAGCKNLKKATILASIAEIPEYTFKECTSLQEVELPNSIERIKTEAFWGCSALQTITIPDSVTEIDYCAFINCKSLQDVIIPNYVTTIGVKAFYGCSSLQEITIPSSVTTVGSDVFDNCSALQKIYVPFKEGEVPTGWSANWNYGCNAQIIYQD